MPPLANLAETISVLRRRMHIFSPKRKVKTSPGASHMLNHLDIYSTSEGTDMHTQAGELFMGMGIGCFLISIYSAARKFGDSQCSLW